MQVLTRYSALGIDPDEYEAGSKQFREALFNALDQAYLSQAHSDWYLYQDWDQERFLFGSQYPELLKAKAETWNSEFPKLVRPALMQAGILDKSGMIVPPEAMKLDDSGTYAARQALEALDNHWTAVSEKAVYFENDSGYPYFRVHLPDRILADIREHPEDYLAIEVFPK